MLRMALLQAALLEHAAQRNLHTTMVFHQRVEEAAAFAEQMPATAAELYTAEASAAALAEAEELPASSIHAELYELEESRHVPPERGVGGLALRDHPIAHRRTVIHRFANGIDAHNRRVHRAFLSSVRALGVGVDITDCAEWKRSASSVRAAPKSTSCRTSGGRCVRIRTAR
ncbi:hypothetical protein [Streptomyces formicae]|uniref:hypothetical protein n=1 Tax=Streptomyces formicae TaxID=1616117 RepID=UPI003BB55AC8